MLHRKRRDTETALGIFRRDTDEVEYQENGLPGNNFKKNGLYGMVHD